MPFLKSSSTFDNLTTVSVEDKFKMKTNSADGIKIVGRFSIRAVRTENNILEMDRKLQFSTQSIASSTSKSKSHSPSKTSFKNILIKLLPPCRLKKQLQKKQRKSKCFANISPTHICNNDDNQTFTSKSYLSDIDDYSSDDNVSYEEVTSIEDAPITFVARSEVTTGSLDSSKKNLDSKPTLDDSLFENDDDRFDNFSRQDKRNLETQFKDTIDDINKNITESLSVASSNDAILINNVCMINNENVVTDICSMVEEKIMQLEYNVRDILEKKDKSTMEILESCRSKLAEKDISRRTTETLYKLLLKNANETIACEEEKIAYFKKYQKKLEGEM